MSTNYNPEERPGVALTGRPVTPTLMPMWSEQAGPAPVTYDNRPGQYKATRPWKDVAAFSAIVIVLTCMIAIIIAATRSPGSPESQGTISPLAVALTIGFFGFVIGVVGWIVQAVRNPKYVTR